MSTMLEKNGAQDSAAVCYDKESEIANMVYLVEGDKYAALSKWVELTDNMNLAKKT